MKECENTNCGYYYKTEEDDFPCCHYNDPWPAPCEYDDEEEKDKMPKFRVIFTQYYSYEVEAESDEEAFDLAYDDFCSDMQNPLAHTGYDECRVEEIEEEE